MAEQAGELRHINWDEHFPFTRIFKSFRMAVQPVKLGLALAGIVLMGVLGYLLDGLWSASSSLPVGPEVWAYWQVEDIDAWRASQIDERSSVLIQLYSGDGLLQAAAPKDLAELNRREAMKEAIQQLKAQYRAEVAKHADQPEAVAGIARSYEAAFESLEPYRVRGIFSSFLDYEQEVVGRFLEAARSVLMLDWDAVAGGTREVLDARHLQGELRYPGDFGGIGMIGSVILALRGFQWLLAEHPFFAIIFLLGSLAIWSLFGGAICRMSALTAARDEQISARSALAFAGRKFFGFFSAPLLPVGMIVMIGVLLILGGLVFMAIPYVGDIVGPILLILALVGGFIMTLVAVGAIGGGGLLWPTIGVEGSDGFDAISRSYSYFFSRPWRLAFYAIVAAIYGAVTYVVLRYFVYIMLRLTRYFVSLGVAMTERPGTGSPEASKLEAMWPAPTPENLMGDWSPLLGLMHWERAGAAIVHLWVLLIVLLLCAYLASFFFSAWTIIYLLLRQRVDATDIEDVFVDAEEEVVTPAAGVPVTVAGTPSVSPAGPGSSPETPPSSESEPPSSSPPA